MKQKKYNHLCKVPNTDEGRAFIAKLKGYMKDTESCHRIRLKGRNPIVGAKAYNNGSDGGIRLAEAKNIALYLTYDKSPYQDGFDQAKEWYYEKGIEGRQEAYKKGFEDGKEDQREEVTRDRAFQLGYREGRRELLEYLQSVINTEKKYNEQ
jgi:hypothetical protein